MSAPKFTPGPWSVNPEFLEWRESGGHGASPDAIVSADGLAVVTSSEWTQLYPADAHLIAASPELYKALKMLVPMLAEWHKEFPDDVGDNERPCIEQAITALAKAHGETP